MADPFDTPGYRFALNRYAGNGVTTQWDISFAGVSPGYISQDHVRAVSINDTTGVETPIILTPANFILPTRLQITPAIPVGYTLEIRRNSPKDEPMLDYVDGALMIEKNLDTSNQQTVYAVAEMVDRFADALSDTEDFTMQVLDRLADVETQAQTAETAANDALEASGIAITTANAAAVTANEAVVAVEGAEAAAIAATTAANNANAAAVLATNAANAAETTAAEALDTAENAETVALGIAGTANTALTTANSAVDTAEDAVDIANGATTTANAIAGTANTALSTANAASTTAGNAVTTANAASGTANAALAVANAIRVNGNVRLAYISPTQLRLIPYNGGQLICGGVQLTVGAAGVNFSNSGLAASTSYYLYAYNNGGTIALEATTLGAGPHAPGSDGIEVKASDNTRTLVGMFVTSASSQFVFSASSIQVASWYNRLAVSVAEAASNSDTTSTSYAKLTPGVNALMWANTSAVVLASGVALQLAAGTVGLYVGIAVDGTIFVGGDGYSGNGTSGSQIPSFMGSTYPNLNDALRNFATYGNSSTGIAVRYRHRLSAAFNA